MADTINLREVLAPNLFAAFEAGATHILIDPSGDFTVTHGSKDWCGANKPKGNAAAWQVREVSRQIAARLLWWAESHAGTRGSLGRACDRLADEILESE